MGGWRVRVRGQVQGVGFRPFIWQLAQRFGVNGEVLNDAEGVLILCDDLPDGFIAVISAEKPPLARVDAVESEAFDYEAAQGFVIAASGAKGAETRVTPDAATCPACLAEINGDGRRKGYAFTNCTHCGPRFTILKSLPYDRAQTTMGVFDMCPACRAEYENPADRRFHAQPIACPDCGPRIWSEPPSADPIATVAAWLRDGKIIAIKGLGGFHLACDATNADAIALLRNRKRRATKPLALMAPLDVVKRYAIVTQGDEALLTDPAAPIVLLPDSGGLPEGLAPGQDMLGWMLPYTPLHHLLLTAVGRPLVMTSGNLSGEPQVIGNDEAREKLGAFADGFLMHDRDIARRLDDSVERSDPPVVLRRARGRVPGTLPLPEGFADAPQVVAYGAHVKSAICLLKNGQALLSHHLGDLNDALTWEEFVKADADYAALFDHKPTVAACDKHQGYRSSIHAAGKGLPLVEVQHHHAHLAACLAENLWPMGGGKVVAIVLDGLGLGDDGTIWGGEVLLGDYRGYERVAHLRPAPLPGGDGANREPWRNLLARLDQAGIDRDWGDKPVGLMRQAIRAGVNAPLSSSMGRLFDAAAALLGFKGAQSYEGEAAMWLEALAGRKVGLAPPYPWTDLDPADIFTAMIADIAAGTPPEIIAYRFHASIAQGFADAAAEQMDKHNAKAICLTGGCYQNATLARLTLAALDGRRVLVHSATPANDGSIALGQALIAAAQSF